MERINSKKVYKSKNSQGVKLNNIIFLVSVGINSESKSFERGLKEQARRVMENFKTLLEENNSSMDKIIKMTIYIKDINKVSEFNDVYYSYFFNEENRPVRCCVEVSNLGGEAEIEAEVIAEL